jgi:hypothetical protein
MKPSTRMYWASGCLVLGLMGYLTLARAQGDRPGRQPADDKVHFVFPKGARERTKAKEFAVEKKLKWEWKPAETVTVQAYQGDKLVKEWMDAKTGTEVELPGSGETELKIWAGGRDMPDTAIWVWIK